MFGETADPRFLTYKVEEVWLVFTALTVRKPVRALWKYSHKDIYRRFDFNVRLHCVQGPALQDNEPFHRLENLIEDGVEIADRTGKDIFFASRGEDCGRTIARVSDRHNMPNKYLVAVIHCYDMRHLS